MLYYSGIQHSLLGIAVAGISGAVGIADAACVPIPQQAKSHPIANDTKRNKTNN